MKQEAIWMLDRPFPSQRSQIIEKSDRTLVQTDRMVYAVQLLVVSVPGDPVHNGLKRR